MELGQQLVQVERLGDIVSLPQLEQAYRLIDGAVAGNEKGWRSAETESLTCFSPLSRRERVFSVIPSDRP